MQESWDGAWVLVVRLPFAEKDQVNRSHGRRAASPSRATVAILLPDSLRRRRVVDAVVDRDRLEVVFGERG